MKRTRAFLAFALAFAWFSVRASHAWLASGFVDPVGRFGAQDEAFYSRIVIEILRSGNWLVPTLLDRMAYFKPPLLYWLSTLSVLLLGPSHYAFRLPSLLAGAGICALVFHWIDSKRGPWAAAFSLLLLMSDYYLIMLSSLNMMDALAAFCGLLSIWSLHRDPQLKGRGCLWLCAIGLAGGLLTKSVAGLVPVFVIGVWALAAHRGKHPGIRRLAHLASISVALAAPWFVYTLLTHGKWFWTEHVLSEIFNNGKGLGPLSTQDSNIVFYAARFFKGDPVTACITAIGVTAAVLLRRVDTKALVWLLVTGCTLLLFRQHAATYLLPVVVASSILVGVALPDLEWRQGLPAFLVLLCVAGVYLWKFAPIVWSENNVEEVRALVHYCNLRRDNPLMILEPGDEYFSLLLPFSRIYYGFIDQGRPALRQPIDWRYLGVSVTVGQFQSQDYWWPIFRKRLTEFGLDPALDPRATHVLIPANQSSELLIEAHPELDFYVPQSRSTTRGSHTLWAPSDGRVWLLSQAMRQRPAKRIGGEAWACRL